MPRYTLTIAYDGTEFCGWQKQTPHEDSVPAELTIAPAAEGEEVGMPPAIGEGAGDRPRVQLRTVQEVVERAVRAVVREPVLVVGASRTDSGVHARGQVAAFTCSEGTERGVGWPLERGTEALVKALNSRLPPDVEVLSAEAAAPEFDPIQGAVRKAYSYTIWNGPQRPLWERRTALHVWRWLRVEKMIEAARIIEGEHDFAAFAAAGHGRLSTVRTVFSCGVRAEATEREDTRRIVIGVEGSGFLWNMVRIIAGTLVEVGKERISLEQVREALASGKRELAGPTVPAQGLCLNWIRYE